MFPSHDPPGQMGVEPSEYPEEVIKNNSFRSDTWRASHLRTFKTSAFKYLDLDDLKKQRRKILQNSIRSSSYVTVVGNSRREKLLYR